MSSIPVTVSIPGPQIKNLTNAIRSSSAHDPKFPVRVAEALEATISQGSGTTAASGSVTIPIGTPVLYEYEVTLSASTTKIVSPTVPQMGGQLVVVIIQDATGGRQITWDTNFHNATVNIDITANTLSVFTFFARVNPSNGLFEWYMQGIPLTGGSL